MRVMMINAFQLNRNSVYQKLALIGNGNISHSDLYGNKFGFSFYYNRV